MAFIVSLAAAFSTQATNASKQFCGAVSTTQPDCLESEGGHTAAGLYPTLTGFPFHRDPTFSKNASRHRILYLRAKIRKKTTRNKTAVRFAPSGENCLGDRIFHSADRKNCLRGRIGGLPEGHAVEGASHTRVPHNEICAGLRWLRIPKTFAEESDGDTRIAPDEKKPEPASVPASLRCRGRRNQRFAGLSPFDSTLITSAR